MQKHKITDMVRGWFVGDFSPTAFTTPNCEAAYKTYKAGDKELAHHHKIATEITLIVKGTVSMNGVLFEEGDVIVVSPGETVLFEAVTDAANVVIKTPGAKDDKYLD